MYVRCIAEGHSGQWEAVCLDFDLAVQGASFDEVQKRLVEAIAAYLEYVRDLPEKERAAFLRRKAPWHMRFRLAWHLFWHVLLDKDDGDSTHANFSLPCPAH